MDDLKLFHPDTKELIDFDSMSHQQLLDLEVLVQGKRIVAQQKLEASILRDDRAYKPTEDFIRYCGITITMCQKHRASRKEESATVQVQVYKQLIEEFITDPLVRRFMESREQELLAVVTNTPKS